MAVLLVVGATDGIGKAVSDELARRGMNLLLLSRSTDRLEKVKSELETAHRVQVDYAAVDYAAVDYAALTERDIEVIREKIMLPKRRFWKTDRTSGNVFSPYFLNG